MRAQFNSMFFGPPEFRGVFARIAKNRHSARLVFARTLAGLSALPG